MKRDKTIEELAKELGVIVHENNDELNKQLLIDKLNFLVANDFQKLISILYRMDISEPKLKMLLKENPDSDAGVIIATLMVERQAEKIKSRREFRQRDNDIDENEKW